MAEYVLDTHALVWHLEGNPRLSLRARKLLEQRAHKFYVPLIALCEAAFLVERGRAAIPSVPDLISAVDADARVEVVNVTRPIFDRAVKLASIPELHDRLIVATALCLLQNGAPPTLITRDERIIRSALVPTLW